MGCQHPGFVSPPPVPATESGGERRNHSAIGRSRSRVGAVLRAGVGIPRRTKGSAHAPLPPGRGGDVVGSAEAPSSLFPLEYPWGPQHSPSLSGAQPGAGFTGGLGRIRRELSARGRAGAGRGRVCGEPEPGGPGSQRQVKVEAAAAAAGRGRGGRGAAGPGWRQPGAWAGGSQAPELTARGKRPARRGAGLRRTKAEAPRAAGRVWGVREAVSSVRGAPRRPRDGVGPHADGQRWD